MGTPGILTHLWGIGFFCRPYRGLSQNKAIVSHGWRRGLLSAATPWQAMEWRLVNSVCRGAATENSP